jgi:hypothetical protein
MFKNTRIPQRRQSLSQNLTTTNQIQLNHYFTSIDSRQESRQATTRETKGHNTPRLMTLGMNSSLQHTKVHGFGKCALWPKTMQPGSQGPFWSIFCPVLSYLGFQKAIFRQTNGTA